MASFALQTETLTEVDRTPRSTGRRRQRLLALKGGDKLGRYVLESALGRGAFGTVFAAWDTELRRRVALKILMGRTDESQRQLVAEARALASVDHENVVRVFDVGEVDGYVVLAMELVEGRTLREWSRVEKRSWDEVARVFADVAEGLAAAHAAGLVHRDVKPDNILLDDGGRVVVVDFGIAVRGERPEAEPTAPDEVTSVASVFPTSVVGTPAYMSPEQLQGHRLDARADQFSLCLALAEALTGVRAFQGDSPEALLDRMLSSAPHLPPVPGLPVEVRELLERGLAVAPSARHTSLLRVADGLRRAVQAFEKEGMAIRVSTRLGAALAIPSLLAALTHYPVAGSLSLLCCLAVVGYGRLTRHLRLQQAKDIWRAWVPMLAGGAHPLILLAAIHVERGPGEAFSAWYPPLLWALTLMIAIFIGRPWLTLAIGIEAAALLLGYWAFVDAGPDPPWHLGLTSQILRALGLVGLGAFAAWVTLLLARERRRPS